jgi:spermidine synthase
MATMRSMASQERYDVIVSDNFHPARSGSGSLYTVEHCQAVHARLATDADPRNHVARSR